MMGEFHLCVFDSGLCCYTAGLLTLIDVISCTCAFSVSVQGKGLVDEWARRRATPGEDCGLVGTSQGRFLIKQ